MKFSCEKAVLQQALSDAIRAVSSKSPIPAMEGFLLRAKDNLEITGYNSEIGIRTNISAMISEPGSLVLPARLTLDIVRSLPDDIVTLESDDHFTTSIKCNQAVFNLIGLNPRDFPELPVLLEDYSISMKAESLKALINGTIFAAADNDNNPVMTGCKFEFSDDNLTVIALDYYHMAIRRGKIEHTGNLPQNFVVPAKALRELERFLSDGDSVLNMAVSKKNIAFSINNTTLTAQLLEGEFINYQNVLPKESSIHVKVQTESLIKSLERTSLVISESAKNYTEFQFAGDVLKLNCTTPIGRAYDECPIETLSGNSLRIGFNSRYILDALRACKDETITVMLNTELSPCIIVPVEGDDYLYFVMPTRLRDNA